MKTSPVFFDDISQWQHIETEQHKSLNGALRNPPCYASVSRGVDTDGDKIVSV